MQSDQPSHRQLRYVQKRIKLVEVRPSPFPSSSSFASITHEYCVWTSRNERTCSLRKNFIQKTFVSVCLPHACLFLPLLVCLYENYKNIEGVYTLLSWYAENTSSHLVKCFIKERFELDSFGFFLFPLCTFSQASKQAILLIKWENSKKHKYFRSWHLSLNYCLQAFAKKK